MNDVESMKDGEAAHVASHKEEQLTRIKADSEDRAGMGGHYNLH